MEDDRVERLSRADRAARPDSKKYIVSENWRMAQEACAARLRPPLELVEEVGEAAFTVKRSDFVVRVCIGREWRVHGAGGLQLPERFGLRTVVGQFEHPPVMVTARCLAAWSASSASDRTFRG
jgi:threonyl-tRNA synthetase